MNGDDGAELADDAWLDDLKDDEQGAPGGRGGGGDDGFAQGWLAGANATRCTCPDVTHPRGCGSYQSAPSIGARLWRAVRGGDR